MSSKPDAPDSEPQHSEQSDNGKADGGAGDAEKTEAASEPADEAPEEKATPEPPLDEFTPDHQRHFRRAFAFILAGCVLIFLVQAKLFLNERSAKIASAHEMIMEDVHKSAEHLAKRLHDWQDLAEDVLGRALARRDITVDTIHFQLEALLKAHPHVSMIRVAYEPGIINKSGYAIGVMRHYDHLVWGPMHHVDGVPTHQSAWYRDGLADKAHWIAFEVLPGPDRPREFSTYTVPLVPEGSDKPIGVLGISVDSDELQLGMSTSLLGRIGYGLLVSADGTLLVHPRRAWVLEKRKLVGVANESGDAGLAQVALNALGGQTGMTHYHDPLSGDITWAAYAPIAYNGWSAIYILYEDEIIGSMEPFQQAKMRMGVTAAVAFVMMFFLAFRTWQGHTEGLWFGSAAVALACTGLVIWIWHLNLETRGELPTNPREAVFRGANGIHEFERTHKRFSKLERMAPPTFIPTGIFLESVTMPASDQANVSGYIWQKYDATIPASVSRGVTFPDDVKNTTLSYNNRAYERKDGDITTIGWQFQVTLRQSFQYQKYPFDHQALTVRLWHQDFDRNNVLVPDIKAYESFNPQTRPGLDATFGVGGFLVDSAFFNRLHRAYNTNFGIPDYASIHSFPELQYSVLLTRDYPGPLLSNLFPLLMVLCTVFVNLMSFNKDDKPWGIYATIASLFFTSLLAHLKLRDLFNIHQIIYLEYFYAATYAVIVIVVCNCFLLMAYPNTEWMTWRKNLSAKLSYWPLLCAMLAIITFYTFY